jgi:hypothetical protein
MLQRYIRTGLRRHAMNIMFSLKLTVTVHCPGLLYTRFQGTAPAEQLAAAATVEHTNENLRRILPYAHAHQQ